MALLGTNPAVPVIVSGGSELQKEVKDPGPGVSDCSSINDSGYNSSITSPEFNPIARYTRSSWKHRGTSFDNLTPDSLSVQQRITSTPNTSSSSKSFFSPDVEAIVKTGTQRHLYSDSLLEVTPLDPRNSQGRSSAPAILEISAGKRISESKNAVLSSLRWNSRLPILRPKSIIARLLLEADYIILYVLKYLSPKDLVRISHVNRHLRGIVMSNKQYNSKRLSYIDNIIKEKNRIGKENFVQKRINEDDDGNKLGALSPRKRLGEIQNTSTSPKKELRPSSSNSQLTVSLSEAFIKEGQNLPSGSGLQKCVKCKSPAQVQPNDYRAKCGKCKYEYCTRCHLSPHTERQSCPAILKSNSKAPNRGIFSNKCKRNLRRL
ncbi:unnamed protein product [Meganyctiphanes norvegica]|uniref:F-box domain-containing protein n=1 Tax=Meganyctiphanes norvegica TaxID=48144 RepID=A0AAV2SC35_MEGNR